MKPFFCYYGGKWRIGNRYPEPTTDTIIEPFAGAAGYSVRHYGTQNVRLYDLDEKIVMTWAYLIRATPEEILRLPLEIPTTVDDLDICEEARYLIGWWLNKGATGPRKSPSKWMRDRIRPNSFWGEVIRDRIAQQVAKIRHWTIERRGYLTLDNPRATWFIDPPYDSAAGRLYRYSTIEYDDLADFCLTREGQVIVCENEGATWLPFETFCDAKVNESKHGGKFSKELIWIKEID